MNTASTRIGGDFLFRPVGTDRIFTREQCSEFQLEIAKSIQEFIAKEIPDDRYKDELLCPNIEKLKEACQPPFDFKKIREAFHRPNIETLASIIKKYGAQGFLSVDFPQKYALNVSPYEETEVPLETTKDLATEATASSRNADAMMVVLIDHRGIGTYGPYLYFENEAQKLKYLPKLASGEWIGAYALTEAGSGSDAMSAKTKAVPSEDKSRYLVNGEKMFITNAGYSEAPDTKVIYTVFVKVIEDGKEKPTVMIIESDYEGVSTGKEESKMGMHTSTTRPLILNNVKVPKENVLGQVGEGDNIVLEILNKGRRGLAAAALGSSKCCLNESLRYVSERKQFGIEIQNFDAIKSKIAESAYHIFLLDSAIYRLNGTMDEFIQRLAPNAAEYYQTLRQIYKDFTLEASLLKVFGSEILHLVTDHAVQCAGGYGYILEYRFARFLMDERINRIWEGTNEINRQVMAGALIDACFKQKLPIKDGLNMIYDGILAKGLAPMVSVHPELKKDAEVIEYAKALCLFTLDNVLTAYPNQSFKSRQQIMEHLANIIGSIYLAESGLLRASQCLEEKHKHASLMKIMAQCAAAEHTAKILLSSKTVLLDISEQLHHENANNLWDSFKKLSSLTETLKRNPMELRRQIAEYLYEQGKYCI